MQLKNILALIVLLFVLTGTNSGLYAAYPVQSQTASRVSSVNTSVSSVQQSTSPTVLKQSLTQPAEFEGIKAKGKTDPGVLSFIFSMAALLAVGLGSITGWLLFPLLGLVLAGFGIYYGVKGFNRHNKGFAIAGFVISILAALSALGDIL